VDIWNVKFEILAGLGLTRQRTVNPVRSGRKQR